MEDALLGADERLYLCGRGEFHTIPLLIEPGHSLSEFGDAHCGLIAMGISSLGHFAQSFDGFL